MDRSNARIALRVIILALLFGVLLLASRLLISTLTPQHTLQPTAQFGVLAARTPTPQPTAAVQGNLLANPSFEEPYSAQGAGEVNVAHGWKAWYFDIPPCRPWRSDCYIPCPSNCIQNGVCQRDYGCMWARPEFGSVSYQQYTYRVHTGETAAKYFSYGRMHEAGFYQQVSISPGSTVEFSAWVQAWMCFKYDNCDYGRVSDLPSDMHLRIGIDPTGGTTPTSTNIIWASESPAFDHWMYFSVEAVAMTSTVTVFTHSRPEWDFARANNDVYVDDANLVVTGPPAKFLSIQPAQPELGQVTAIQIQSNYPHSNARLTVTDPNSAPVTPDGGAMSGDGPYLWTWRFTPTVPGTYGLVFSADTLPEPIASNVRAIAAARLSVQPLTAMLSQTVTVRVSAYYLYPSQQLTVTAPSGSLIATTDTGITDAYVHTWNLASLVTGTHLITFTANLLETPVTANVKVASIAMVDSIPPAPPISTPVNIRAMAYYPYTGTHLELTDPQGWPLTPAFLGRSDGVPFVWTWTFTPVITGTHVYTFNASLLDAPARALVLAGGSAMYLPVIFKP